MGKMEGHKRNIPMFLTGFQSAGFTSERIAEINERALLKKEVSQPLSNGRWLIIIETNLDDCADAFISLAKNSSMTGQSIVVGKYIDM